MQTQICTAYETASLSRTEGLHVRCIVFLPRRQDDWYLAAFLACLFRLPVASRVYAGRHVVSFTRRKRLRPFVPCL